MEAFELLLDDWRGIYIPQDFCLSCDVDAWHVSAGDASILEHGPDHEWYWETWADVEQSAYYDDENGHRWTLYQDGALFAYCEDLMTDEGRANLFGDAP